MNLDLINFYRTGELRSLIISFSFTLLLKLVIQVLVLKTYLMQIHLKFYFMIIILYNII